MKLKSIEEVRNEIMAMIPKMQVVVEVGDGENDMVDLEEVLPYEIDKLLQKRDQHLIQTIRKEVEGIPAHLVDIRQNADDKPEYKDAVLIEDLLTTLEEEVSK